MTPVANDRGTSQAADRPRVRIAGAADAAVVARLVEAYLRATEREKAERLDGRPLPVDAELPPHYLDEVEHPERAYADAAVHVAEIGSDVVGVVIAKPLPTGIEVKRLWVDPRARGLGVGSALLDAVLAAHSTVRLSVWEWRTDAIRLYESRGFERAASWDPRPGLVCMTRSATSARRRSSPAPRPR